MACGGLPGSKFRHGRLARQDEQLLVEAVEQPAQRRHDQHEPVVAVELSIPAVAIVRHGEVLYRNVRGRLHWYGASLGQRLVFGFRRKRQRHEADQEKSSTSPSPRSAPSSGEPNWPKTSVASLAEKKLPPAAAKRPRL